jgi:uncharacterized protein YcaQ
VLAFIAERGTVHPRDVDQHFAHGRVTNYWGGSSNATTHLLDQLQYLGVLRIVRRERGVRVYGVQTPVDPAADRRTADARLDASIDVAIRKYAPLPSASLSTLVHRFQYATPQWRRRLTAALARARARLARSRVDGTEWYWPANEDPTAALPVGDAVRLLAPFDPVVWDRRRFELFWGWAYRFEAYTPVAKRKLGYYALPLLWRDRVIGWTNVTASPGTFDAATGFIMGAAPRERAFRRAMDDELDRMRTFLTPRSTPHKEVDALR